jgi:hypothetical protein
MGLPIGAIYISHRPSDLDGEQPCRLGHVMDGKQRITTIQRFAFDGFPVPARWFPREDVLQMVPGDTMVLFSGLAKRQQLRFGNIPTGVYEAHLAGVEAERELYLLINFGGVPQTAEDRARAEMYEPRFSEAADLLEAEPRGLSLYGVICTAAERRGGGSADAGRLYEQFASFMGMDGVSLGRYEVVNSREKKAADLRRAAAEAYR